VKSNQGLAILWVGVVALIAGVGRLVQHYTQGEKVPDAPPVAVFVASAAFGFVIVLIALRAGVHEFLATHENVRARNLWLAVGGVAGMLLVAFLLGFIGVGR
jgi:uncharacterized membrane protein YdcZ (DUF606 family)